MKNPYQKTMYACFIGYIVQAIVNNFVPLLFVTFQQTYSVPLEKITLLITLNFLVQLLVDLIAAGFVDKIGYRASMLIAHGCSALGLIGLVVFPGLFSSPFTGILLSVVIYAVGGGLLEVLVSPVLEACPTPNKEKAMSLLHSFYCWGHMGVVILSTLFFLIFGIENWQYMALFWALFPIVNGIIFIKAPIYSLKAEGETGLSVPALLKSRLFWTLMLMMIAAGASEQAVSQWASTFAEQGLGISKAAGDLAGPMAFAGTMGLSRLIFGKYGEKLNLNRYMSFSLVLCIVSYLCISLVPNPIISLIGCSMAGFSVGILWPGTFSKASAALPGGGTAMFAFLALGGDLGCSGGPTLAGLVSSACEGDLRKGILAALIFPVLLLLGLFLCRQYDKK